LDGPTEAAELPADRFLRGPHCGLGPALRGRKTTTLVDELPKGRDSLLKPCVGHVGDRDGRSGEYAGWVRIVGTLVHHHNIWYLSSPVPGFASGAGFGAGRRREPHSRRILFREIIIRAKCLRGTSSVHALGLIGWPNARFWCTRPET
jgi:hypothetical protein